MEFLLPSQMAFGAIVAAGIAGSVSLLGLVIAKEQKISEFRRSWLEDLRAELGSFLAHANLFAMMYDEDAQDASVGQALAELKTEILGMNSAAALLRLRLNSDDPESATVLADIDEIEHSIDLIETFDQRAFQALQARLVQNARRLMKSEWLRIRKGEKLFRVTKGTSIFLFVFVVVVTSTIALWR